MKICVTMMMVVKIVGDMDGYELWSTHTWGQEKGFGFVFGGSLANLHRVRQQVDVVLYFADGSGGREGLATSGVTAVANYTNRGQMTNAFCGYRTRDAGHKETFGLWLQNSLSNIWHYVVVIVKMNCVFVLSKLENKITACA